MLADFYIPRLSNDMKLAVQKNHLGGQILYRSSMLLLSLLKKRPKFYTYFWKFCSKIAVLILESGKIVGFEISTEHPSPKLIFFSHEKLQKTYESKCLNFSIFV